LGIIEASLVCYICGGSQNQHSELKEESLPGSEQKTVELQDIVLLKQISLGRGNSVAEESAPQEPAAA